MAIVRQIQSAVSHFISLWSNPQTNAAEIGLTLGLFLVVVMLGVILVMVLSRFFRGFVKETVASMPVLGGPPLVSRHVDWRRLSMALGFIFLGSVLLFLILIPVTSNSSVCGTICHSMNPEYQSWRRSPHADVSCMACHKSVGVLGTGLALSHYAKTAAAEVRDTFGKPINQDGKYAAREVPDAACIACHPVDRSTFLVGRGLSVTSKVHRKHLAASVKCTYCHNRVAHAASGRFEPLKTWARRGFDSQKALVGKRKPIFKYTDNMSMRSGCWRCHQRGGRFVDAVGKTHVGPYKAPNGAIALTRCTLCHARQGDIQTNIGRERAAIHVDALKQQSDVCLACHGGVNSADNEFHRLHSADSDARFKCTTCHKSVDTEQRSLAGKVDVDRQVCLRCHRGKFPAYSQAHRKRSWIITHKSSRGKNTERCLVCHKYKELDFCDQCHKSHPRGSKWVNGGHGKKALASAPLSEFKLGIGPCFRCHDRATECAGKCHKGIMTPHDKLRVWMKDEVRADRERCNLCHKPSNGLNYCGTRCHHDNFYQTYKFSKKVSWKVGKLRHGVVVKAQGVTACTSCHDQKTWCTTQCHQGVTMPHVAGWRGFHFNVAAKVGKAVCARCHNKDGKTQDFCLYCHHKEFGIARGAVIEDIMMEAEVKFGADMGGNNIGQCTKHHHQPSFCIDCHRGNPNHVPGGNS